MAHDMIFSMARMKKPIHTNLSTSFVNLSALVRHLRELQFVGNVELELSSYEADIEFFGDGTLKAREQDLIADRLSFGDDALQRIMIRSKESGGVIHVFKSAVEAGGVQIDREILVDAVKIAAPQAAAVPTPSFDSPIPKPAEDFDANEVKNWTELVSLISELMQTVDGSMAKGNVNFSELFRNASGFVSFDHPFLDPDTDIFSFEEGFVCLRQKLPARDLVAGVTAALARIMSRLREDPYFGSVYHLTMHRLRVLGNRRKLQFEMFGIAPEMQKIIGI